MDTTFDHHVHCGQYENQYYQPAYVIQTLGANGVKRVWLSSTTSNISWSDEYEKHMLIKHVEDELEEAIIAGIQMNIEVTPFYWVVPQRHFEGEDITTVMKEFPYCGFKIHPRLKGWELSNKDNEALAEDICKYADNNSLPILIHTGVDLLDTPDRFEKLFSKYTNIKFVLAHCRQIDTITRLFDQYENVYGDCALCPFQSIEMLCRAGFSNRLLFGTDFPITHWYESGFSNNKTIILDELSEHYHKLRRQYNEKV